MNRQKLVNKSIASLLGLLSVLILLEPIFFLFLKMDVPNPLSLIIAKISHKPTTVDKIVRNFLSSPTHATSSGITVECAQKKAPDQCRMRDLGNQSLLDKSLIHPEGIFSVQDGVSRFRSNVQFRSAVYLKEQPIYDVTISIDEFGRRLVPDQTSSINRRFFMFLGCSFIFGEGVNDLETLPYLLSTKLSGFHFYNYGCLGCSPAAILKKLQTTDLEPQISEASGTVLMPIFSYYLSRFVGDMHELSNLGMNMLYTDFSKDGQSFEIVPFNHAHPIWARILWVLSRSQTLQWFSLSFPQIKKHDLDHYVQFLKTIRSEIEKTKKIEKFVVYLPPHPLALNAVRIGHLVTEFKENLLRAGFYYIDYSSCRTCDMVREGEAFYIPYDGHPSPAANIAFASLLSRDLNSLNHEPNEQ